MISHPLLLRQLRRSFGEDYAFTPELERVLEQVQDAYHQCDNDRRLIENVLEVSSKELSEANSELMAQNQRNEDLLARLRQTLSLFEDKDALFAERDLMRVAIEIERMVAERKEVEMALRSAKNAADAANQAKSDFLANMSHEIRTPLNSIIGMAELLEYDSLRPDVKDCLETIRISGDVLLSLINDILDFSKIEAGQIEIEKAPMDLKMVVDESVNIVSSMASEKALALELIYDRNLPEAILGDPIRVRQVLLNLLMNAVKFTERGKISLAVRLLNNEGGSSLVNFVVKDTGIGIAPDQKERLFKLFSQADVSITRRYGGTGLGLAISQKLVQLMGGEIIVESVYGEGDTFQFSIPVLHSDKPTVSQNLKSGPPLENFALGKLCPLKILIAEDNKVNQQVIQLILHRLGYETVIASNGQEVLNLLDQDAFDLLLMDIQMPVLSGLEATRIIKERSGPKPRIIALTANATREDRSICLEAGMDDYLAKPVRRDRLATVIEETFFLKNGSSAKG